MNTNMNMNANVNLNVIANVIVCLPYQPDFILLGNRMKFLSECVLFLMMPCGQRSGGIIFLYRTVIRIGECGRELYCKNGGIDTKG